ncbi:tyrosine-type recombinase/integrase [Tenacibaculum ovolyticum]|uniref:tyrosine-type recombinase/integrase n=1 Tax=Tenacibaculum ovolyticum TaxID=104270 RepID=UPI0007ED5085|nr:site-specific integrase [Tenacibaculum ovolyticum]
MAEMKIFSDDGERLYLNNEERGRFEDFAKKSKRETMTLALTLLYTGCRISEALNIQYKHIDSSNKSIVIESLKKRKKGVYRSVPIPDTLLDYLNLVHEIKRSRKKNDKVWNIARNTAFLQIKKIFKAADITGANANPKGLRHSFGVHALVNKVDIISLQKWLGHAHISTTSIYANAQGEEERMIAKRMWK